MVTPNPIAEGSEIEALTAIRAVLATQLGMAEGAATAPISRELRAILDQLRRLGATAQESPSDEVAARRAKRRAGRAPSPADPGRPASG